MISRNSIEWLNVDAMSIKFDDQKLIGIKINWQLQFKQCNSIRLQITLYRNTIAIFGSRFCSL